MQACYSITEGIHMVILIPSCELRLINPMDGYQQWYCAVVGGRKQTKKKKNSSPEISLFDLGQPDQSKWTEK
jgi:hypothetical protein